MTEPRPAQNGAIDAAPRDPETSVEFTIDVEASVERAFRVFAEGIDDWWPRTHHIGQVEMSVVVLEPRVGGRWYEIGVDGSTCDWGVVLEWQPSRHIAMSWHLDGEFKYRPEADTASRVDVWFHPGPAGGTTVTLTHTGLQAHGETWRRLRDQIGTGWPTLLALFGERVGRSVT